MKSRQDLNLFESPNITRAILTMAIPTVIGQLITVVYNYTDAIFVGLLEDPTQTAAIALSTPLLMLSMALSNFFGIGGGTLLSRFLGSGDRDRADRITAMMLGGTLGVMLLVSSLTILFRDGFLHLLGATPSLMDYGSSYIFWSFSMGCLPNVMSQVLGYVARAYGAAREAGLCLSLGGLINVMLDPLFIFPFGFGLGCTGAAVATFLSNVITLLLFTGLLMKHREDWRWIPARGSRRPTGPLLRLLTATGLPSAILQLLSSASNMVVNNLTAPYGDSPLAAMGIAKKLDLLPHNTASGVTQAALPFMAYSYGKEDRKRTDRTLRISTLLAFGTAAAYVVLYECFAPYIARIFIRVPETVGYTARFIRMLCPSVAFLAVIDSVSAYFQAVNKPRKSLLMSVLRKGLFDIPLMFLFDRLWGVGYIILVQPILDCLVACLGLVMFRTEVRNEQIQKS